MSIQLVRHATYFTEKTKQNKNKTKTKKYNNLKWIYFLQIHLKWAAMNDSV